MEKVFHDCFYIQKTDNSGKTEKKPPVRYDRSFAPYLTEAANNHIQNLKNRDAVQIEHDKFIFWCIDEYLKNGASIKLVNTLNMNVCYIGHQCHVIPINKVLTAKFVAHLPHKPPPTIFAAYMFSNMVSLGWLEGLRRCKNPDCLQFFIGRSNTKWCTKTCGSNVRVKEKRKRDRKKKYS